MQRPVKGAAPVRGALIWGRLPKLRGAGSVSQVGDGGSEMDDRNGLEECSSSLTAGTASIGQELRLQIKRKLQKRVYPTLTLCVKVVTR